MTVDLEALASDLRAAGVPNWMEHDALKADASLIVHASGRVEYDGDYDLFAFAPREIETIAIIARHIGAGQSVAAGETLYRQCDLCLGVGWVVTADDGTTQLDCDVCLGEGYVPVDPPAPLSAEEIAAMVNAVAAEWDVEPGSRCEGSVFSVLAALPERHAVPVEGAR